MGGANFDVCGPVPMLLGMILLAVTGDSFFLLKPKSPKSQCGLYFLLFIFSLTLVQNDTS